MPPELRPQETFLPKRRGASRTSGRQSATPTQTGGQLVPFKSAAGMVWRGPEYPLLTPGKYQVRGVKIQGPEWVRSYLRWSLRVEFALTTEVGNVSAFYNLGSDKDAQRIGRQSRYYKAWVVANRGHPYKGQMMTPEAFLEGQFFEVEVENCDKDAQGNLKPEAEVYSRITKIVRAWQP